MELSFIKEIDKLKEQYNIDIPAPFVDRSYTGESESDYYTMIYWEGDRHKGDNWNGYIVWGSDGCTLDCSAWENIYDEKSISIASFNPSQDDIIKLLSWVANKYKKETN